MQYSAPLTVVFAAVPLTGPSIQTTMALSSSSIYVNWSVVAQQELNGVLQGYQVLYIDTAGQNKSVEVNATVTSAVLTNLTAYTVYDVSVKARTGPGYGPLGATASQRSEEDVPAQVTGVDVKLQSSTDSITANVSWSPLTNIHGTITAYIVYYQPVNGLNSKQLRTSGNVSTILLRNLADKQNYEFIVQGFTSAGAGANSTLTTRTGLPKKTGKVSNITVKFPNSSSALLSWTVSSVPDHYTVYAYYQPMSSSGDATLVQAIKQTVNGYATSITLNGLNSSTFYAFDIIATNVYLNQVFTGQSMVNFKDITLSATFFKTSDDQVPEKTTPFSTVGTVVGAIIGVVLVILLCLAVLLYKQKRSGSHSIISGHRLLKPLARVGSVGAMHMRKMSKNVSLERRSTAAHSTYSIMEYGTDPELHGKHDSHRVMAALGSTAVLPKLYHKSDDVHNDYEDEEDQSGKVVWKKNDTPVENLNDARLAVLSNGDLSIDNAVVQDSGTYSWSEVDKTQSQADVHSIILTVEPMVLPGYLTNLNEELGADRTYYETIQNDALRGLEAANSPAALSGPAPTQTVADATIDIY
eukprot:scpid64862/ scgid19005/ Neuronal cell adhesion molecule; Neuronal surface protein Bravo; NgCAM-related cell adhesion molecule